MEFSYPTHILSMRSYDPGLPVVKLKEQFGFNRAAVLWNNENARGASPRAIHALRDINALSYYPDASCFELRQSIAEMSGWPVDGIVPGNGSEGVLNYVLKALFGYGDELVTSDGTFAPVYIWCQSHNIPFRKIPLDPGYKYDVENIIRAAGRNTRMIYVSNPNNPTGSWLSKDELKFLLDRIPKDAFLLLDEAYIEYTRELVPDFPDGTTLDDPRVIILRTFSKAFGLAGLRIGYALCNPAVAGQLNKMRLTFEPGLPAQVAGTAACKDVQYVKDSSSISRDQLKQMEMVLEEKDFKVIPFAGNFLMTDCRHVERAAALNDYLLKNGVLVRPLNAFGLPHCIRITSGLQEDTDQFKEVMSSFKD